MEKCVFRQPELSYLGDVVTQDGVKPDPEKIQAITDMPTPTNATELQRVLGMVTSWPIHTKSVSQNRSTQILLEKDSDWQWQHEHELAWNGIKETLSKHPVPQYYDESKSLKVSSDASKDGIGAS